jgi:hypothetical protein
MRKFTPLLVLSLALTAAVRAEQATEQPRHEQIAQLIRQLGSDKYADRDKATRELDNLGPAALPQLRQAQKDGDAETRKRAKLLVSRIQDRLLAQELLTAKKVHLKVKDAAAADVVAELSRQSGYPIQIVGSAPTGKVTLDTGETTFWDALDQVCRAAKLVETDSMPGPKSGFGGGPAGGGFGGGKKKGGGGRVVPAVPNHEGGILLTAGQPTPVPTWIAGSVRIRLVQTVPVPGGATDLILEVAGEPRLAGFSGCRAPGTAKATGDRGQEVAIAPLPAADDPRNRVRGQVVINGTDVSNSFGNSQGEGGPFHVTLRLQPGEQAAAKIKELTGKLTVLTLVDSEPRFVVDDILKAAGKSVKDQDGATIHIRNVKQMPGGEVQVEVTMEKSIGGGLGGGGAVVINGGGNVVINGGNITIGGTSGRRAPADGPRLLDAKGQAYTLVDAGSNGFMINGGHVSQTVTYVYRPQEGQGAPAQLMVPGQRSFSVEVPFTFKNVVLP